MRIGLFVNDISTELAGYTSTCLALEATKMGHEVWYISAADFVYSADDAIRAHARSAPSRKKFDSNEAFLKAVQTDKARIEKIAVDDLDVLLLRSDPSVDMHERPWAHNIGVIFGQVAAERGVIVLNDPAGLAKAMNKLYFQQFPEPVRPRTLISRDREDLRHFVREHGTVILKPLQGSGGQNVFKVDRGSLANLNQMIDAVERDGYVIAQEFLRAADRGDVRLFLINGRPFAHRDRYAAMARVRAADDIRSNMHVGGQAEPAEVDENILQIAEAVRPKLIRDGMFLVGLDIVGDKLLEVNVFSPGGLYSISKLTKVNFPRLVVEALERKLDYERIDQRIDNTEIAVL